MLPRRSPPWWSWDIWRLSADGVSLPKFAASFPSMRIIYLLLLIEPSSWRQYISPRSLRPRKTCCTRFHIVALHYWVPNFCFCCCDSRLASTYRPVWTRRNPAKRYSIYRVARWPTDEHHVATSQQTVTKLPALTTKWIDGFSLIHYGMLNPRFWGRCDYFSIVVKELEDWFHTRVATTKALLLRKTVLHQRWVLLQSCPSIAHLW
jgi:hypothetical protein